MCGSRKTTKGKDLALQTIRIHKAEATHQWIFVQHGSSPAAQAQHASRCHRAAARRGNRPATPRGSPDRDHSGGAEVISHRKPNKDRTEYIHKNDKPCPEIILLDNAADYPCDLREGHKGPHQACVHDREQRLATITWRTKRG